MKSFPTILPVCLGLVIMRQEAHAVLMADAANNQQHKQLAGQYAGRVVWVRFANPGGEATNYATGFTLTRDTIGFAGHVALNSSGQPRTIVEVGVGTNYVTSPGESRPVVSVTIHPDYDNNNFQGTPDFAVAKVWPPFAASVPARTTIGSFVFPEDATIVGYGVTGSPGNVQPQDGFNRSAQAAVALGSPPGFSTKYTSLRFGFASPLSLNGKAMSGDSGAPAFNSSGQLSGVCVYQFGDGAADGATVVLKLDTIADWIEQMTTDPRLRIENLQTNAVLLAWSTNAVGFALQQNASLSSTNWISLTNSPVVVSNENQVILSPLASKCFFRLSQP